MKGSSGQPRVEVTIAPSAHQHVWEPVGIVTERDVILDGRTERPIRRKLLIRSCPCGAIRRTEVGRA